MNNTTGSFNRKLFFVRFLFALFLALTFIFIFANSSDDNWASGSKSLLVTNFINNMMAKLGAGYRFTEHQIRKFAHFSEYSLLGLWLLLNLRMYVSRVLEFVSWPLFVGLLTAVLDEFSQSFSQGRSSQVTDVLIDFVGVTAGILAGILLITVAARFSGSAGGIVRHRVRTKSKHL